MISQAENSKLSKFTFVFTIIKVPSTPPEGHKILMDPDHPFDIEKKIAFYKSLGFEVVKPQ